MLEDIARSLAGLAVTAVVLSLSGCNAGSVTIDGMKGVPLAELDLSGPPPEQVALFGPDTVNIVQGERLTIQIDGDAAAKERLRFVLKDGKLSIGREGWTLGGSSGGAKIEVTVPGVRKLVLAGSGTMHADALRGESTSVSIAGSGDIDVPAVDTGELKVEVIGSGDFKAAGKARSLKLTIAGSGTANLTGLTVEQAKVDVAGSGDANFASDGEVIANIMGSGDIRVKGRAKCKVTAMGSGTLVCAP
ncbi:MAG: head GIN domain-containing protein [Novosphingobium sp.]